MLPLHDNNPTRRRPLVTIALIIICTIIYAWQVTLSYPDQVYLIKRFGFTPAFVSGSKSLPGYFGNIPASITILTSMFLHGSWMHLIGNMLYLWIFGNNIEDALGRVKFLIFYLACGIVAALSNSIPDVTSQVPMIGASGAISGVLGAYLLLFPHARVLILIPLIFIFYTVWWPAWVVLVFWFIWQIISSILIVKGGGGGIAWEAHIGGFIAGFVLILILKNKDIKLLRG